ncbi:AI-2E family transporter [Zavarzinella formosa]|uniref:AI-2E family transporter n=1 Tax=Zavarzinella formosa TaxID=360055 RepID=UPI0002FA0C91|nr:AI-2E family transporter [Zavarzinella formosa]
MNLNLTAATRIGLNVLALLGATLALYLGHSIFIPLVIAALLAVILWPAASWLHHRFKLPWAASCITVISLLVVANLGIFSGFALALPQTLEELPNPRNPEQLERMYTKSRESFGTMFPTAVDRVLPKEPADSTAYAYVTKFLEGGYVTDTLLNLSKIAANWLFQSIVILFILLFMLMEGEFLAERIKGIFGPTRVEQTQATKILTDMGSAVRSYLIWRTVVNIGLGLFLGVVYTLFDLRQPWTWALFTAILCYVPYIGTLIAGVPPLLDALLHVGPGTALIIMVMYMIVVTVEGYLIVPLVMSRTMDLNATTVMLACLFWDLVWGTPGLFLAMPLMAGIKAVCMHVDGFRPWGELMGTEEGYRESQEEIRLAAIAQQAAANDATQVMEDLRGG